MQILDFQKKARLRIRRDPKLSESQYADWVKFSALDETQSYYLQGAARANKPKHSFEWAKFFCNL